MTRAGPSLPAQRRTSLLTVGCWGQTPPRTNRIGAPLCRHPLQAPGPRPPLLCVEHWGGACWEEACAAIRQNVMASWPGWRPAGRVGPEPAELSGSAGGGVGAERLQVFDLSNWEVGVARKRRFGRRERAPHPGRAESRGGTERRSSWQGRVCVWGAERGCPPAQMAVRLGDWGGTWACVTAPGTLTGCRDPEGEGLGLRRGSHQPVRCLWPRGVAKSAGVREGFLGVVECRDRCSLLVQSPGPGPVLAVEVCRVDACPQNACPRGPRSTEGQEPMTGLPLG